MTIDNILNKPGSGSPASLPIEVDIPKETSASSSINGDKEENSDSLLDDWQITIQKRSELHPCDLEGDFPFEEPVYDSVEKDPEKAKAIFSLLLCDFMGLDSEYPGNIDLSLSFLIPHLEELQQTDLIEDRDALNNLIKFLKTTFRFNQCIQALSRVQSVEDFQRGKRTLINQMVETLRTEGRLILAAGYAGQPAGHALIIDLNLDDRGNVQGKVLNRGEGGEYHSSEINTKEKLIDLALESISLSDLKNSLFLNALIDLQMPKLIDSETEFQVEGDTNYRIQDVYEIMIDLWPAEVTEGKERGISLQHSGSCSMKPFMALIKREVGRKDGNTAKHYLTLQACLSLYRHVEIETLSLDRIKEALEKFNRSALKLDREKMLHPELKKEILQFSDRFFTYISNTQTKLEEQINNSSLLNPHWKDDIEYEIRFNNETGSIEIINQDLPPFEKENFEEYLKIAHAITSSLVRNHRLKDAKRVAHEVVLALPNPSDPFWKVERSVESIQILNELSIILFRKSSKESSGSSTPGQALLFLKMVIIFLVQSQSDSNIPNDVIDFYGGQIKWAIEKTISHYKFVRPEMVKLFYDCHRVLSRFYSANARRRILIMDLGEKDADFEDTKFDSLIQLREDIEMRFLNDFVQTHPEFFEKERAEGKPRFWFPTLLLQNDIIRFHDQEYRLPRIYKNPVFNDPKYDGPQYDPIRKWVFLRRAYWFFILSGFIASEKTADGLELLWGSRSRRRWMRTKSIKPKFKCPLDPDKFLFLEIFLHLSEPLQDFQLWFLDHPAPIDFEKERATQNQQLLLRKKPFIKGLRDFNLIGSEFQELLSIQTYDALLIPQLIGYFKRHFERLKQPYFQNLFSHLLFSWNKEKTALILQEVMESDSKIKEQLFDFLKEGLETTEKMKWLESHLFFLRVLAQSVDYLAENKQQDKLLEGEIDLLEAHIEKLMEDPNFSAEEREKILFVIVSLAPYIKEIAPRLLVRCKQAGELGLILDCKNNFHERPQLQEDYLEAQLILNIDKHPQGVLPPWVVDHDLFPFDTNFYASETEPGLYAFCDSERKQYKLRVDSRSGVFRTYQFIDGRWYEFMPNSPFSGKGFPKRKHPCVDGVLTENIQSWLSVDEPKIAKVFLQGRLICSVTEGSILHPTMESLRLAANYDAPLLDTFARLAPKSAVLAWKDADNEVVRVEIPKFNLVFKKVKEKWVSLNHPSFFLDTHPNALTLEPYEHYLILKNLKGKRVALMPSYGVASFQQKGLEIAHIAYQDLQRLSLFVFELDEEDAIKLPEQPLQLVYLVYLALRKYDYALANKIIHQMNREQPDLDESCCFWIQELDLEKEFCEKNLDKHPQAISLRIQLRLLMKRLSFSSLSSKQIEGLKRDYFNYLNLFSHIHGSRLSKKLELECIEILDRPNGLTPTERNQIIFHQQEIDGSLFSPDPNLPKALPEASKLSTRDHDIDLSWMDSTVLQQMWDHLDSPTSIAMEMRPGSGIIRNFLYYYAIARELPEKHSLKKRLLQMLPMGRFTVDGKIKDLHLLLRLVAKYSSRFPKISDLRNKKDSFNYLIEECFYDDSFKRLRDPRFFNEFRLKNPQVHATQAAPRLAPTKPKSFDAVPTERGEDVKELKMGSVLLDRGLLITKDPKVHNQEVEETREILDEMKRFFLGCQEGEEPCVRHEFGRLVQGISKKRESIDQLSPYVLDLKRVDETENVLQQHRLTLAQHADNKKQHILDIAHHYPDELLLEKNGRMLRPLSIEELILHYGTENEGAIYISNPSLTQEDMKELKRLINEYLILSTDLQQMWRMEYILKGVKTGKERADTFVKISMAQRVYQPEKEPHLLTFEYFENIRLRKDQYESLHRLVKGGDIELEARTGFGKSKVLIPLWLFIMSRKKQLSMMALPSSLFDSQYRHLKRVLGKAFDATIIPLRFDRAQANNPKYLRRLNEKLENAKRNKQILLTTTHSLHGMTNLKLKESLASAIPHDELVCLREKIARQISSFFDESNECFNIRHRYDYAIGAPTFCEPKQYQSAIQLYKWLFFDNPLMDDYNFEFLPQKFSKDKTTVTQEEYAKVLLPKFAEIVAKHLQISSCFVPDILEDLQGEYHPACEKYYETLSPQQLEEYSRLKKQLTYYLPQTLFRKCDDGYRFSPNSRLAVPALHGTRKKQSEFSEVEHCIDFTIQANLKHPFTRKDIETFIDKLKLKILEVGPIAVQNTPEGKLFLKMAGHHDFNLLFTGLDAAFLQKLEDHVNKDLKLKLKFIDTVVLSEIKTYKKKIVSTSFNLIRAIHHLQAASGTVNPDALPPSIQTLEDPTAVIENLIFLWKNSQKRIYPLASSPIKEQLVDLLQKNIQEQVIIDVAGSFRDLDSLQIAETILSCRDQIEGVLIHDEEGRELVLERDSGKLITREESVLETKDLFIFIRKSKAIGTDIKMKRTAKAIVTIDRDSYSDLVFQGTGRMRGLSEGQIASYAVAEEDARIIYNRKENLFKHLLAYTVKVQGKQRGEDAFYVLQLYLEDLIDSAFWNAASNEKSNASYRSLFKDLEEFLVKRTQSDPLSSLRKNHKELPIEEAVYQLRERVFEPIQKFCETHLGAKDIFDFESMQASFDAFVDYSKLPLKISLNVTENTTSIVEIDADAIHDEVNDTELENENASEREIDLPSVYYDPAEPLPWDGNYAAFLNKKEPDLNLLGMPIHFSPNFRRVAKDEAGNDKVQKPAYQYLVHCDREGECQMLLLDLHDAERVLDKMVFQQFNPSSPFDTFYLYSGSDVIAFDGQNDALPSEVVGIQILQKLFTYHPILNDEEKEYLSHRSEEEFNQLIAFTERLLKAWPRLSFLKHEFESVSPNSSIQNRT